MLTPRDAIRLAWWLVALLPADTAARWGRRPVSPRQALVIRLDVLGDFIVWLDAARGLRQRFPAGEWEITLLGNQSWTPLAEQTGYFDQVWGLDRKKFVTDPLYRYRLLRRVHRAGFAAALAPAFSRDFLWTDTTIRMCGAPERIGYHGDPTIISETLMRLADRWYTRIIRSREEKLNELERNADFVRGVGVPEFRAALPVLPKIPESEQSALQKSASFPYYVLVPGAGKEYRQWPADNFGEIARRIHTRTGLTGIVSGGGQDFALGERLCAEPEVFLENRAGATSLGDMVHLISNAAFIVSNETSAVHIAASVGTPAVSITGGGHFGRYVPYRTESPVTRPLPQVVSHPMPCFGCDWHCIYKLPPNQPKPCIANISLDSVWAAVEALLPALPSETGQPGAAEADQESISENETPKKKSRMKESRLDD